MDSVIDQIVMVNSSSFVTKKIIHCFHYASSNYNNFMQIIVKNVEYLPARNYRSYTH